MRRYNRVMWLATALTGRSSQVTVLTACPKGHERIITYDDRTPEQDWTLTCPLCGAEHRLFLPEILRSDL